MEDAVLILADGTTFKGVSCGAEGVAVGEVVFNTSMTGYQEILTDPSYAGQFVTLTYPHIGNVGTNNEDEESAKVHAKGLIIRSLSLTASNFRSADDLSSYLKKNNTVGITEIDTRKLTRILRTTGTQVGCLMVGKQIDLAKGAKLIEDFGSMIGQDLAIKVTCSEAYDFDEGVWELGKGFTKDVNKPHRVVVYDYGVKKNILRMLVSAGCTLHVVPAKTPAKEVLDMNPDGIFLSNGPGDPEACTYAIESIREFLKHDIPLFGICLGHQLLGLAMGGKTKKMKFGHHGANHPVINLKTKQVAITSQNHGFEVDEKSLPSTVDVTHRSLFDQTLQGISIKNKAVFSFQGHPEASPGPQDIGDLFSLFVENITKYKQQKLARS